MYDPDIARFLQEDTYRGDSNDPLSLNLYTYCLNNPLIYFDPTGHNAWNDFWGLWSLGMESITNRQSREKMKASNTASLSDGVNDGIFEQIGVGIWNWSLDEAALWAKPSDELQYYNDQAVDLVGRDTTAGQVLNYVGTRAAGAEASILNSIKGIPSTIYLGAKTVYNHESHKISQLMLNAYTGNDLQVKARLSIEEAKAEEAEKSNSAIWITGLLGIRNNIYYVLNPKNKINYIFNTDLSVSEAEQDTTAVITTAMMVYGGAKGLNALKNRLNAARGAVAKGISVGTEPNNVGSKMLTEGAGKTAGTGRAVNNLKPDPSAGGAHSTFKINSNTGEITNYKTWEPNPRNPNGFDLVKGYDGTGAPHINKITGEDMMPHIHDKTVPGGVRMPEQWEIPQK